VGESDERADRGAAVEASGQEAVAGPPPLPPLRGAGLAHIVIPGTVIWFALFVVLLFFIPTLQAHGTMVWLWTALAGWVLGLMGLSIYFWQRHAARRGTRGSSQMALEETFGSQGSATR
jgi:hypothetical protein